MSLIINQLIDGFQYVDIRFFLQWQLHYAFRVAGHEHALHINYNRLTNILFALTSEMAVKHFSSILLHCRHNRKVQKRRTLLLKQGITTSEVRKTKLNSKI